MDINTAKIERVLERIAYAVEALAKSSNASFQSLDEQANLLMNRGGLQGEGSPEESNQQEQK